MRNLLTADDIANTAEDLESILRIGFEYSFFQTTQIYRSLRDWQAANNRFIILK